MYNAFEDNPHLAEAPGYEEIVPDYVLRERTGTDGTYHIVGLPGHGVFSAVFRGKGDGYLTRERLALSFGPSRIAGRLQHDRGGQPPRNCNYLPP